LPCREGGESPSESREEVGAKMQVTRPLGVRRGGPSKSGHRASREDAICGPNITTLLSKSDVPTGRCLNDPGRGRNRSGAGRMNCGAKTRSASTRPRGMARVPLFREIGQSAVRDPKANQRPKDSEKMSEAPNGGENSRESVNGHFQWNRPFCPPRCPHVPARRCRKPRIVLSGRPSEALVRINRAFPGFSMSKFHSCHATPTQNPLASDPPKGGEPAPRKVPVPGSP
jgi:hypothetical protein